MKRPTKSDSSPVKPIDPARLQQVQGGNALKTVKTSPDTAQHCRPD